MFVLFQAGTVDQIRRTELFHKMNNSYLSLRNEKTIVEIDSLYLTSKLQLNIIKIYINMDRIHI